MSTASKDRIVDFVVDAIVIGSFCAVIFGIIEVVLILSEFTTK